jgi:4-hydroxybenzoate polyprenyltransferase
VVEQEKLTKGKAALLLVLSAVGAAASAAFLNGWHVYAGFAVVAVALFAAFLYWNRKD